VLEDGSLHGMTKPRRKIVQDLLADAPPVGDGEEVVLVQENLGAGLFQVSHSCSLIFAYACGRFSDVRVKCV